VGLIVETPIYLQHINLITNHGQKSMQKWLGFKKNKPEVSIS
jgi:hypothetical protein